MAINRKSFLILSSVLLGLVSGFVSSIYFLWTFAPGILFSISVSIMLKFILKMNFDLGQYMIFVFGSVLSYFIAFFAGITGTGLEVDPATTNLFFAGLLGGAGVCISFAIFRIKFSSEENFILTVISILSSLAWLLDFDISKWNIYLPLFIFWQGAMMGCLAYFTINKMQKVNSIQETSTPLTESVK